MTPDRSPRVISLSEVRAGEMEEVLEHERAAWDATLGWDYSTTASLIRRSVASGTFSGFGLRQGSRIVAYSYYLPDLERSLVGTVHALPEAEDDHGAWRLVDRTLAHLVRDVRSRRIESQFLFFGDDDPARAFLDWGAERYPRQFLRGRLDTVLARLHGRSPATLRPFRPSDAKAATMLIHRGFLDSSDAEMSDCYRSAEGCAAFVEGVLIRSGCGTFEPRASFLAVEDGTAAGVILTSRVSPALGHIVQISVDPAGQRRGTGRSLMRAACESLLRRGFTELSLSVTLANQRARAWYLALGLRPIKDFDAYVWQRQG